MSEYRLFSCSIKDWFIHVIIYIYQNHIKVFFFIFVSFLFFIISVYLGLKFNSFRAFFLIWHMKNVINTSMVTSKVNEDLRIHVSHPPLYIPHPHTLFLTLIN